LYKSNNEKKTLNRKCTQYFETTIIERVLANGEIEQTVISILSIPTIQSEIVITITTLIMFIFKINKY